MEKAKGLAILTVFKAGLGVSGRGGEGLVIAKTSSGWSAPSAIGVGGAGFGFQIGIEITDLIFVLNTQEAVNAFSKGGNVSLGGEVSLAAGSVGKRAEGGVLPWAAIYTYSRSEGLFAGVSLEGTILIERKDANAQFYGKPVTAKELLSGKISPPSSAKALYEVLNNSGENSSFLNQIFHNKIVLATAAAIIFILILWVIFLIRKRK